MRYFLLILLSLVILSSCKNLRSNMMMKTNKDFVFDKLVDSLSRQDYRIATNDVLVYRIFTNNGYKLIDLTSNATQIFRNEVDVIVESDGYIKMPLVGRVKVAGMTIRQAETLLEDRYDTLYVDPFVNLRVTNKRVIVFPGNGGQAKVLPLSNNNTTVFEALASAGGVLEDGKAYKVKLVRANPEAGKPPLVYLMDLSHIEGLKDGNSIVQAGDIIYVDPRYRPLFVFNREAAPVITLLTSLLLLYQFTVIARR